MTPPILSVSEAKSGPNTKSVANLLPCRIRHDGHIGAVDAYWKPTKSEDGTSAAFFRGRKLKGTTVALPEPYRGVVVERSVGEQPDKSQDLDGEDGEGGDKATEVETLQITSEFDEVVVWGHENVASAEEDPYIRGVEEWLQVAEKIHEYSEPEGKAQK